MLEACADGERLPEKDETRFHYCSNGWFDHSKSQRGTAFPGTKILKRGYVKSDTEEDLEQSEPFPALPQRLPRKRARGHIVF